MSHRVCGMAECAAATIIQDMPSELGAEVNLLREWSDEGAHSPRTNTEYM